MRMLVCFLFIFHNVAWSVPVDVYDLSFHEEKYLGYNNVTFHPIDLYKNIIEQVNNHLQLLVNEHYVSGLAVSDKDFEMVALSYKESIEQSSKAVAQAIMHQVEYIPAIVFNDGEAVIYGTRELGPALNVYMSYVD